MLRLSTRCVISVGFECFRQRTGGHEPCLSAIILFAKFPAKCCRFLIWPSCGRRGASCLVRTFAGCIMRVCARFVYLLHQGNATKWKKSQFMHSFTNNLISIPVFLLKVEVPIGGCCCLCGATKEQKIPISVEFTLR